MKIFSLFLVLSLWFSAASSRAQTGQGASGTEFYVAFGPNEGGEGTSPTQDVDDIYIASNAFARGTVEVPALSFQRSFTTVPGQVTTIELPNGNNNSSSVELSEASVEQVIHGMAVHITSDSNITVFGLNHKLYSSDAFMGLPNTVLGTEYRTINYTTSNGNGDLTPGEFWIVAVSDSTNVTITLKDVSSLGSPTGVPTIVQLNKCDSYLVEGNTADPENDLTGSQIQSDKPIAVFSGHKRTAIPDTAVNIDGSPSRDHLVEELVPVAAWGDSAIVVPFATSTLPDLVRVVCARDSTQISVNGTPVPGMFNAGDFYEITHLHGVTSIVASKPIEVGQYMHTSLGGIDDPQTPAYGDPALTLVFPVEQFAMNYTIVSIENTSSFTANFVNIVASSDILSGVLLDGVPIDPSEFQKIPNSRFAYAQHQISQGTHNLSSTSPFGVTVYALGPVDSYAYPGAALIPATYVAPSIVEPTDATTFSLLSAWPNPIQASDDRDVSVHYFTQVPIHVTCTVWDELGRKTGSFIVLLSAPNGDLHIPHSLLPKSGYATIEVMQTTDNGPIFQRIKVQIE